MNSFNALFYVQHLTCPVRSCSYHVHQDTDGKGRPAGPVYGGELQLLLEVPEGTLLPHWANDPRLALNGRVVFSPLDGVGMGLLLEFEEGVCVSFEEHLQPNSSGQLAYYCQISIVARRVRKQGVTYENARWPGGPA